MVTCWERADLLVLFSFVMSNCEVVTFPFGILGQVWCLIVSIPDLCPLSYFGQIREENKQVHSLRISGNIISPKIN